MNTISVQSEWGELETVICSPPTYINKSGIDLWIKSLNKEEILAHPQTRVISQTKLNLQYGNFIDVLEKYNVEIINVPPCKRSMFQVFTRDTFFVIKDQVYFSSMVDPIRKREKSNILKKLERNFFIKNPKVITNVEGGDVFVLNEGKTALIGIGESSDEEGARTLKSLLYRHGVNNCLTIKHHCLHLDCCVAPLPNNKIIVCKEQLHYSGLKAIQNHFKKIYYHEHNNSLLNLSLNILWINKNTLISNINSKKLNNILRKMKLTVIELDFSEFIALWGSFRCACAPIKRKTKLT